MPKKKRPLVKKAAKKKSAAPLSSAGKPPSGSSDDKPRAAPVPCLSEQQAREVVGACLPAPANDQQVLGQLFPLANARDAFCTCVRDGAVARGMTPPPAVPCGASNTIGDVVGALKC